VIGAAPGRGRGRASRRSRALGTVAARGADGRPCGRGGATPPPPPPPPPYEKPSAVQPSTAAVCPAPSRRAPRVWAVRALRRCRCGRRGGAAARGDAARAAAGRPPWGGGRPARRLPAWTGTWPTAGGRGTHAGGRADARDCFVLIFFRGCPQSRRRRRRSGARSRSAAPRPVWGLATLPRKPALADSPPRRRSVPSCLVGSSAPALVTAHTARHWGRRPRPLWLRFSCLLLAPPWWPPPSLLAPPPPPPLRGGGTDGSAARGHRLVLGLTNNAVAAVAAVFDTLLRPVAATDAAAAATAPAAAAAATAAAARLGGRRRADRGRRHDVARARKQGAHGVATAVRCTPCHPALALALALAPFAGALPGSIVCLRNMHGPRGTPCVAATSGPQQYPPRPSSLPTRQRVAAPATPPSPAGGPTTSEDGGNSTSSQSRPASTAGTPTQMLRLVSDASAPVGEAGANQGGPRRHQTHP